MAGADRTAGDSLTPRQIAELRAKVERGELDPTALGAPAQEGGELSPEEAMERSIAEWRAEPGAADPRLVELVRELAAKPYSRGLFDTLRLIQCICNDKPRLGDSAGVRQDPVRLGQEASLRFAPSSLAGFLPAKGSRPPRLLASGFGLMGPNGPMPLHFTQYVLDRQLHVKDHTLARFLDIFHHRAASLFFKAWAINEPTVEHDRPDNDRFAFYIASLIGLGGEQMRGRDALPDNAKLHYAGRQINHSRDAEGLEAIVGDYFKVPCRLEQFVGQWLELPDDAKSRLGESPETGTLGVSTIVGSSVWDVQQRFRLVLGPMDLKTYRRFLPGGGGFERLSAWVRTYAGFEYTWDARLILRKEEVPGTALGGGARLGWTSWIKSGPAPSDADTLVLRPPA